MSDKPENGLWYASVGGNPTEVVRVTDDGWYSIGCADVHDFGGVEFIRLVNLNWWPVNAATKAKTAIKATKVQFTVAKSIGIVSSCLANPEHSVIEQRAERDRSLN